MGSSRSWSLWPKAVRAVITWQYTKCITGEFVQETWQVCAVAEGSGENRVQPRRSHFSMFASRNCVNTLRQRFSPVFGRRRSRWPSLSDITVNDRPSGTTTSRHVTSARESLRVFCMPRRPILSTAPFLMPFHTYAVKATVLCGCRENRKYTAKTVKEPYSDRNHNVNLPPPIARQLQPSANRKYLYNGRVARHVCEGVLLVCSAREVTSVTDRTL